GGIARADAAARDRADGGGRDRARRALVRGALAAGGVAAPGGRVVALTRRGHVILVADARAVAACRRARVAVTVRAGRAVGRERVRLHAYPGGRIPRARLAARDRAHVVVAVRARLAGLRRPHAGARVRDRKSTRLNSSHL